MDAKVKIGLGITGIGLLSGVGVAMLNGVNLDPEAVKTLFGEAMSYQVTQFTIAFSLAAWIHSREVKKEIALQFGKIVTSIEEVSTTLKKDLTAQSDRLSGVEVAVKSVSDRVEVIEKQTPKGINKGSK